ncbi:hypothetical protein WG922_14110 [Ramlibacter sp. AN1015]|uniref:hypothetical protein n=1 Tax=Ramlibacter sp. AN1015 TaxID=3133428 RepID=UPI0030BF7B94
MSNHAEWIGFGPSRLLAEDRDRPSPGRPPHARPTWRDEAALRRRAGSARAW